MAVGIVAGTPKSSTSSGTTLTSVAVPGNTAGDVSVIPVTAVCSTPVISTPSGWSVLVASTEMEHTSSGAHAVFYRRWQSGDPSTITITISNSGRIAAAPFKLTGTDATSLLEGTASVFTDNVDVSAGGTVAAPSKTATDSRFLICTYGLRTTATTGGAVNWDQASDMTELIDEDSNINGFNNASVSVAYKVLTGSGSTGTKSASPNSAGQFIATSFLINPGVTTTDHTANAALSVTASRSSTAAQTPFVVPTFKVGAVGIDDQIPVSPPSAPLGLTAVASDGTIDLTWSPPASDGGASITSYSLELTATGETTQNGTVLAGQPLQFTFSSLTNLTTYTVSVVANNGNGSSPATTTTATPHPPDEVPEPPINVQALGLDRSAYVTWVAPTDVGSAALTGFLVTATHPSLQAPVVVTTAADATSTLIYGLPNDSSIQIVVQAVNSVGPSEGVTIFVTPTATPADEDLPTEVTSLAAVPRESGFTASWQPPLDEGSRPVYAYQVRAVGGAGTTMYWLVPADVLSANFKEIPNDDLYTITVSAWSAAGHGPGSDVGVDLNGDFSPVEYPWYVGVLAETNEFSFLQEEPYVPPDPGLPTPIWYAFPPGSVFRPSNFGLAADDEEVVRVL